MLTRRKFFVETGLASTGVIFGATAAPYAARRDVIVGGRRVEVIGLLRIAGP